MIRRRSRIRLESLLALVLAIHALVWLPMAPPASAEVEDKPDFHPTLRKAVDLYNSLDYEAARAAFSAALAAPGLDSEEQRNAFLYLGFCLIALGHREQATQAFEGALRLNPAEELDRTLRSPKILEAFEGARARLRAEDKEPPRIAHEPLRETVPYSKAVEIPAEVTDNFRLKSVKVHYRRGDEPQFFESDLGHHGGASWIARLPGYAATGDSIAYFIEATDEAGNVATEGSPSSPITIAVAPSPTAKPWYTEWWVWGLILATVAGGTVGGVLASQSGGQGRPDTGTALVTF